MKKILIIISVLLIMLLFFTACKKSTIELKYCNMGNVRIPCNDKEYINYKDKQCNNIENETLKEICVQGVV